MPTANQVEVLQKLQDGAAKNNATVMLEGNNFRVHSADGASTLYEPDEKGSSFRVAERANVDSTSDELKKDETISLEGIIKEMADGPKRRKEEAEKQRLEAEKNATKNAAVGVSRVDNANRLISPDEARAQAEAQGVKLEDTKKASRKAADEEDEKPKHAHR